MRIPKYESKRRLPVMKHWSADKTMISADQYFAAGQTIL